MSKIKLFTHTDLDGVGCAILAILAFDEWNVDIEYCNYDDVDEKITSFIKSSEYDKYDMVYITDISVSKYSAEIIDQITKSDDEKWTLFDHHVTANWLNEYEWANVISGPLVPDLPFLPHENIIMPKTSGTEIFFIHLFGRGFLRKLSYNIIDNAIKFSYIVRDYDTWRWKELGTDGLMSKQLNDLFYIYGRDAFIGLTIHMILNNNSYPEFSKLDKTLLEMRQKDIDIYVEAKNKQLIEDIDRFGHVYGIVFAERFISELGNRLSEMHPNLEYIAIIDISKGRVSYRTIHDDLNLGTEIAHSYGGGGHAKAAGNTFDRYAALKAVANEVFVVTDLE